MTDIKTKAQAVKDAVGTVYPNIIFWETDRPTVITAIREVVNQLQYYNVHPGEDMILDARAVYDLCEELEKL